MHRRVHTRESSPEILGVFLVQGGNLTSARMMMISLLV
jgi:hypothetical protein